LRKTGKSERSRRGYVTILITVSQQATDAVHAFLLFQTLTTKPETLRRLRTSYGINSGYGISGTGLGKSQTQMSMLMYFGHLNSGQRP